MIDLTCSMVLRCDDCVKYHLGKSHELKMVDEEIFEVLSIANLIGGVIPHLGRATEYWNELKGHV